MLLKAAAVAICGAAAMIMTQPEEAARELARIVAVVTGVLALLYFSIAQWRKER